MAAAIERYAGGEDHGALATALRDGSPGVRAKALYELGRMGEYGAEHMGNHEKALRLLDDPSPQVQAAAVAAVGLMGRFAAPYGELIAQKLAVKGGAQREVRRAAVRSLGNLGSLAAAHAQAIEDCLDDADLDLAAAACVALGAVRSERSVPRLLAKLREGDVEVVVAACRGLGLLSAGADELAELLAHSEARVRAAAMAALGKDPFGAQRHLQEVVRGVGDRDAHVRMAAVGIVAALGERAAAHSSALGDLLEAKDPGVRAAAASALGGIGEKAAQEVPRLEKLLQEREEDTSTLVMTIAGQQPKVAPAFRKPACAAAAALAVMGRAAHRSAPKIADGLDSFDEEIRIQCACALAGLGAEGAKHEDRVVALLDDPQPMAVAAACYALGSMAEATQAPSPAVADRLAERAKDKHPAVRGAAVQSLGKMGDESTARVQDIARCLTDRVGFVRAQAVGAIAGCGEIGSMFANEACRLLFDSEPRVRAAAAAAMPRFGRRGAAFLEELACLLEDEVPEVRAAAVRSIGRLEVPEAVEYSQALLELADGDPAPDVRQAAREAAVAMKALGWQPPPSDNPQGAESLEAIEDEQCE